MMLIVIGFVILVVMCVLSYAAGVEVGAKANPYVDKDGYPTQKGREVFLDGERREYERT